MASITNQWLKEFPERSRPHSPESCTLTVSRAGSGGLDLRFEHARKGYKVVSLSAADVTALFPVFAKVCDLRTQRRVAIEELASLSDAEYIDALHSLTTERAKRKGKSL